MRRFLLVIQSVSALMAFSLSVWGIQLSPEEKSWLSQHSSLTVAFDAQFPPYSFLNDSGQLEGFSVDVFQRLAQDLGVTFKYHANPNWQDLYESAKNKGVDMVATMVKRPDRQPWFHFTSPYIFKSLVVMTHSKNQDIYEASHLKNKTVALVKGYQYSEQIRQAFPSIKPLYTDDMLEALNAVSANRAEATISFAGAAHFFRTRYLLGDLKIAAIYDASNAPERIAVREDYPLLGSILNKALAAIPEADLQNLRQKWLPVDALEDVEEIVLTADELAWIERHPTIRLGIDPEFAPFEYIDGREYRGMTSDYVKILNRRLGLDMTLVDGLSWEEVVSESEAGNIDVLSAVGKTRARQEYLTFSNPYLSFHRVIITRLNQPFLNGLRDLKNMRVAVQDHSSHLGYLKEHSSLKPILYDTLEQSLLAVAGGEVDAFVGNLAASTFWIRKLNLTNLKVSASVSDQAQDLHFAIRKDWPELVSILNKGLENISESRKKVIADKWLHFKFEKSVDYTTTYRLVVVFATIILGILLWNLSLKRAVRARTDLLQHNAFHDQITHLPNRFLMFDRLEQLLAQVSSRRTRMAMLSINLDDFKNINDTLGHRIGDIVLQNVAERIEKSLSLTEVLGRVGGDQFLVILPELKDSSEAAIRAQRIIRCTEEPFDIEGHSLTISLRVGISIFPTDGRTPEELLKAADSATHFTKEQGKGTYAFYTRELNEQYSRKLKIEQHLTDALANDEFYIVFQPKVDIRSKTIVSFEALMRWKSPILGDVSPNEFIAIIEQNGTIESLGMFALDEALSAINRWRDIFDDSLTMAVNLSPRQFRSKHLVRQIQIALNRIELPGESLELEITEGILLDNNPQIEASFNKLKEMGIHLSLDDFGTGYASMSYLRKFNFDILKIDREFINNLTTDNNSLSIVSAMIAMAKSLNMKVVAEGIEEESQLALLEELECTMAQGWLLGRPERLEKIEAILQKEK